MATTQTRRPPRYAEYPTSCGMFDGIDQPLTAEQWGLVLSVDRLCWKRARQAAVALGVRPDDDTLGELHSQFRLAACAAAVRFDPARGLKFTTLCCWYLRNCWQSLFERHDRSSTRREHYRPCPRMTWQFPEIGRGQNRGLGDGDGLDLGDVIESRDADPAARTEARDVARLAAVLLRRLPPKQRTVLWLRRGLGQSLADAGAAVGVSKERARQLEELAVRALLGQPTRRRKSGPDAGKPRGLTHGRVVILQWLRERRGVPASSWQVLRGLGRGIGGDKAVREQLKWLTAAGYVTAEERPNGRRLYRVAGAAGEVAA